MFNEKDLEQIRRHGLTLEQVEQQIENFRRGFPSLGVVSAASPEDGVVVLSKEECERLAAHQSKFIHNLEMALVRIEHKTYGICKTTGKLIPRERLLRVPHATETIEAKESRR